MDLGKFNIPNAKRVDRIPCDLPYYIVGDEIFPLKPWLMSPYPGTMVDEPLPRNHGLMSPYPGTLIDETLPRKVVARKAHDG